MSGVSKKLYQADVRKIMFACAFFNHEALPRPQVSNFSMELLESHDHACVGGVLTNFRDLARLTILPVFGDKNVMGVVLEVKDEAKLHFSPLS